MSSWAQTPRVRTVVAASLCAVLAALASASTTRAAITVGQTAPGECGEGYRGVQHSTGGPPGYVIPFDGVVTSFAAPGAPGSPTKLLLLTPVAGDSYNVAAKSDFGTFETPGVQGFETRLPAKAGQHIGVYGMVCVFAASFMGDAVGFLGTVPEPDQGSTHAFPVSMTPLRLSVSATVEPDADGDGFGDESQDCAPGDPTRAEDCAPPDTTIISGPKNKTKKKTATFAFTSSEPGATFECSLDGAQFVPCSSPDAVKVKKGKHGFQVRAKDPAGNVDGSAASDDWKVKKRKRR
jgi:hypothetical protein